MAQPARSRVQVLTYLVIVFAFLDKLVLRENITLAWAAATVTLAFVLLVLGIWIERRRK